MRLKIFFSLIFILIASSLLIFYWLIPSKTIEFGVTIENSNFSLDNETGNMQFYQNMRYPEPEISYHIYDCPLQKRNDMERAFDIIENLTVLNFYSVNDNEKISVTCDSKSKIKGGLFIAGEGGPTNITRAGEFSVILNGKILLIKESVCERPNIALHELLHALGFEHSSNPNNIMYNITKCKQTVGADIPELINELYLVPSYSDLSFENVSAIMHGRYLDANISLKNNGLKDSEKAKIMIYADEKLVKEIELDILKIGYGRIMELRNILVKKISVDKLEFFINSSFNELEKENNKVILEIKK